jgi:hypothetical protein
MHRKKMRFFDDFEGVTHRKLKKLTAKIGPKRGFWVGK